MWSLHGLTSHHPFTMHKALSGFFLCIFGSLTCLKKSVFRKGDLLWWKVPASLSLFLKNGKIPAFLYLGKGPEHRPYRPWAEISNHGRAYTQALLLYLKHSMCTFPEASYSPLTNSHHFARATIQQARQ